MLLSLNVCPGGCCTLVRRYTVGGDLLQELGLDFLPVPFAFNVPIVEYGTINISGSFSLRLPFNFLASATAEMEMGFVYKGFRMVSEPLKDLEPSFTEGNLAGTGLRQLYAQGRLGGSIGLQADFQFAVGYCWSVCAEADGRVKGEIHAGADLVGALCIAPPCDIAPFEPMLSNKITYSSSRPCGDLSAIENPEGMYMAAGMWILWPWPKVQVHIKGAGIPLFCLNCPFDALLALPATTTAFLAVALEGSVIPGLGSCLAIPFADLPPLSLRSAAEAEEDAMWRELRRAAAGLSFTLPAAPTPDHGAAQPDSPAAPAPAAPVCMAAGMPCRPGAGDCCNDLGLTCQPLRPGGIKSVCTPASP